MRDDMMKWKYNVTEYLTFLMCSTCRRTTQDCQLYCELLFIAFLSSTSIGQLLHSDVGVSAVRSLSFVIVTIASLPTAAFSDASFGCVYS